MPSLSDSPITLLGPWPPPAGGVATHVRLLHKNLVEGGFQAEVLGYGGEPGRGGEPIRIDSGSAVALSLLRKLRRGSILHDHSPLVRLDRPWTHRGLLIALRANRSAWVITIHDGSLPHRFEDWPTQRRDSFRSLIGNASHVIAVNETLAAFLARVGLPEDRISAVGPLLPGFLTRADTTLPAALVQFLETHDPVVVVVGSMVPEYDYATVLRASSLIRRARQGSGVILATAGGKSDAAYERAIIRAADSQSDSVMLVSDLPSGAIASLLSRADVLVRGYRHESYGLSRVEALALGTPVVATVSGEQRFVITYEHGNEASLARALERALVDGLSDPDAPSDYFQRLAEGNLRRILSVYSSCMN